MNGKKILIVSQTHLCRNPRVLKEALTLSNCGYQVKILTSIYSKALLTEDKTLIASSSVIYSYYFDLSIKGFNSFFGRLKLKLFKLLQQKFGMESKHSLGYAFGQLKSACIAENADLYIMHQEMPLILGNELTQLGYKVAFDIEDFYSEDLLVEARKTRPIGVLKQNERLALHSGTYVATTSLAMSNYFQEVYGGKKATVIRNVFPLEEVNISSAVNAPVKLYWFSQSIGPGRGLETLIEAVNAISTELEIHLRGNVSLNFKNFLQSKLNPKQRIYFHPPLPNHEIVKNMANYDIGLALEPNEPLNKQLTSSNKIYHYLTGGLPVLASDTAGQIEVFNLQEKKALFIFKNNDSKSLAELIETMVADLNLLNEYKRNALEVAKNQFNWQIEEKKLINLVKHCLS